MDFSQEKKVIADRWHINNNGPIFFVGFTFGKETSVYMLDIAATKSLTAALAERIQKFGREHGPVPAGPTVSPMKNSRNFTKASTFQNN